MAIDRIRTKLSHFLGLGSQGEAKPEIDLSLDLMLSLPILQFFSVAKTGKKNCKNSQFSGGEFD